MDSRPRRPRVDTRIVDIGVRGGAARPSTGYAFLAIQRQAARICDLLRGWADDPEGDPPPLPRSYSRRSAFLDRVFLAHLVDRPRRAPELFVRMFDRVRPDALARFLFDGGSLADDARVMSALPAAPLVAAALKQYVFDGPAEPEPE